MPDYRGWEIIRLLGEGGQGKVFLARSPARAGERKAALATIYSSVLQLNGIGDAAKRESAAQRLADAAADYSRADGANELGALKQFKMPSDGEGAARAAQRFKNEIDALKSVEGEAAALRVLEFDYEQQWMITDFHPAGSLGNHPDMFRGHVYRSLIALRPIIALLAKLHAMGSVHRDLKPQNILVSNSGELVLGDFGIVFLEANSRPTELLERVGSRDWMPPWAHTGLRVDDVNQSFDVFPLGKVLWCMISGQPVLPYWYHRRLRYDLTAMFLGDPTMHAANRMLDKCIVEHEAECLSSAASLLPMVDATLEMFAKRGQILDEGVPRPCHACGAGRYLVAHGRFPSLGNNVDVYECDSCDHVQIFGRSGSRSRPDQAAIVDAAKGAEHDDQSPNVLELSSPSELRLRISPYHQPGTEIDGLLVSIINDRSTNLKSCRSRIREATSFDRKKSAFRESFGFKPAAIGAPQDIRAGDIGKSEWLLKIGDGRLVAAGSGLDWPAADGSELQIWRLDVSVEEPGAEPWEFGICVEWARGANTVLARLP